MKFLMLVCLDTEPVEPSENVPDIEQWVATNDRDGKRLIGYPVRPEIESTVVRVRGGKPLVTDGPFLETKEILAGFDVLECRDLDEAIEVAAGHPMAVRGVLDLRPLIED